MSYSNLLKTLKWLIIILVITLIYIFFQFVISYLLLDHIFESRNNWIVENQLIIYRIIFSTLLLLIYLVITYKTKFIKNLDSTNTRNISIVQVVFLSILFLLATIPLLRFETTFEIQESSFYSIVKLYDLNLLNVLSIIFISSIYEELIFRGLILKKLAMSYNNIAIPLIFSSLSFALIHFSFDTTIPILRAFLFGLISGFIYLRSGTLLYPIIFHVFYNLLITFEIDLIIFKLGLNQSLYYNGIYWFLIMISILLLLFMVRRINKKVDEVKANVD